VAECTTKLPVFNVEFVVFIHTDCGWSTAVSAVCGCVIVLFKSL